MEGYSLRQLMRDARVSRFEEHCLLTGILLLVAAAVSGALNGTVGGPAWFLGTAGLSVFGLYAISRGVRLYRAGVTAALPESVGRVGVRVRPRRMFMAATAMFALVLPAAAAGASVVLVDRAWLVMSGGLLLGCSAMLLAAERAWHEARREEELRYVRESPETVALLGRLCMRADIPVPQLVVEPGPEANAWTTRGRIHVTTPLLKVLDSSELEAVLAHEQPRRWHHTSRRQPRAR